MTELSQNEMMRVNLPRNEISIEFGQTFQTMLETIPTLITKSETLLQSADPSEVDDDAITETLNEMQEIKNYQRDIEQGKTEIRRLFNDARDDVIAYIDQQLEPANIKRLEELTIEMNIFKQDVMNARAQRYWEEVEAYYNETLSAFPNLKDALPYQTRFDVFQASEPKLVTRSKSWKLNDARKATVNHYLNERNESLETLRSLNSPYFDQITRFYDQTGKLNDALQEHTRLAQEAERLKRENEEKIRLEAERLAKEKLAQAQQAAPQPTPLNPLPTSPMVEPGLTDVPFGLSQNTSLLDQILSTWFSDSKKDGFTDIEGLSLIHSITQDIYSPDSKIQSIVKTPADALRVIHQILERTTYL